VPDVPKQRIRAFGNINKSTVYDGSIKFAKFMRNWCCRMHLDNRESPLDLLDGWRPCLRKQKDTGLAREGLMIKSGGVGGGGLGHPACLIATLFAILCVANLKNGSLKSLSTKSRI
jgi:hypothetical protein